MTTDSIIKFAKMCGYRVDHDDAGHYIIGPWDGLDAAAVHIESQEPELFAILKLMAWEWMEKSEDMITGEKTLRGWLVTRRVPMSIKLKRATGKTLLESIINLANEVGK